MNEKGLLTKINRRRRQINGGSLLSPSIKCLVILYRRDSIQFVCLGNGRGSWGKLLGRQRVQVQLLEGCISYVCLYRCMFNQKIP